MGSTMDEQFPLAAKLSLDAARSIGNAALGSATALISTALGRVAFGPSELQAEWAELRRKSDLPDKVLQVEFA